VYVRLFLAFNAFYDEFVNNVVYGFCGDGITDAGRRIEYGVVRAVPHGVVFEDNFGGGMAIGEGGD